MVQVQLHSIFPPCDDFLSVLTDPEEDFRPLTPSGLDLPTNSVVTFLSHNPSPPKILSNPTSSDEPPALSSPTIRQPPNMTPDVAPSASVGPKFSPSSLKQVSLKKLTNFPHLTTFFLTFDHFYHGLISSNSNLITLLLDVNIAVNITQIMHAEQNDPAVTNIYNIVSNQNSVNGK